MLNSGCQVLECVGARSGRRGENRCGAGTAELLDRYLRERGPSIVRSQQRGRYRGKCVKKETEWQREKERQKYEGGSGENAIIEATSKSANR